MNALLWILQVLLAVHTMAGAIWKVSHSEQTVPSLRAIPHGGWLALTAFEVLLAAALLLPALSRPLARLAPVAAACLVGEMLLFSGVHLASGDGNRGQLVYWLVVAVVCAFVAWGRLVLRPL